MVFFAGVEEILGDLFHDRYRFVRAEACEGVTGLLDRIKLFIHSFIIFFDYFIVFLKVFQGAGIHLFGERARHSHIKHFSIGYPLRHAHFGPDNFFDVCEEIYRDHSTFYIIAFENGVEHVEKNRFTQGLAIPHF